MIPCLLVISLTGPEQKPAHEEPAKAQPPAPKAVAAAETKSTILIDAKQRADDIAKAYDYLKRERPTLRISARTNRGTALVNIAEIVAMPNGTLLLFKTATPQGTNYQIVSVDEFLDFYYSP